MTRFIPTCFVIATITLAGSAFAHDNVADPSKHERATAAPSQPAKTGAGLKFTKVANNGADLPPGAALGAAAADWACTRDGITGLTWEIKTASGLRSKDHTYTWYFPGGAASNGAAGAIGTDTCDGTLSAYSNQCNTANFTAAVNSAKLCGYADWRLPTLRELQSLVDFSVPTDGQAPTIYADYFPNTQIKWTWSSTSFAANPSGAWGVRFHGGFPYADAKTYANAVRLVRGGQWFDIAGAFKK